MTRQNAIKLREGVVVVGAASLLALSSCLAQHEPQGSDTATSWLKRCVEHTDCRGGMSCIEALCTLACAPDDPDPCRALAPNATCEAPSKAQSACDLRCGDDASCRMLGSDFRCEAGYCRPFTGTTPTGTSMGDLAMTDALLTLSDPDLTMASPPVIEWRADHWTVSWLTGTVGFAEKYPAPRSMPGVQVEPRLQTATVSAQGEVDVRETPYAAEFDQVAQGGGGRVGITRTPLFTGTPGEPCKLSIADTDSVALSDPFTFDCQDSVEAVAAPIDGTTDWLVAWPSGRVGQTSDVLLARYRPGSSGWLAGPWTVLKNDAQNVLSIGTSGKDAWLAWAARTTTSLLRIPDAAAPNPSESAPRAEWGQLTDPVSRARYTFVGTPKGTLMFYINERSLQSVVLAEGKASETTLTPTLETSGTSSGTLLGAQRIAERELTVVCFPLADDHTSGRSNRVAIVTVDDQGQLRDGPIEVSEEGSSTGCALSWSGSALLVAWWESSAYLDATEYSMIRAKAVVLP